MYPDYKEGVGSSAKMLVWKKWICSNTIGILKDSLSITQISHLLLCYFVFEKH